MSIAIARRLLDIDSRDGGRKDEKEKLHEFMQGNHVLKEVLSTMTGVVNKGMMEMELEAL